MLRIVRDLLRYNIEFAIGITITMIVGAYAALSLFAPMDPSLMYMVAPDQPPSWQYWFGTNSRGQDMFWQLSAAMRSTLTFGVIVAVLSRLIAITVGLLAGYLGGWVDRALMFFNDIVVAIPIFPILVMFYFVLRSGMDTLTLAFITASLGWPYDARLIRSVALGLRHREFTRHALFSGMSPLKIMFQEHMPYVLPVVLATALGNMIFAIGLEVTLAVLGFTNITAPSIGTTLYWANAHSAMIVGVWWWIAIPVVILVLTFLGLFLLAVSINEYVDPRSRLRRMVA